MILGLVAAGPAAAAGAAAAGATAAGAAAASAAFTERDRRIEAEGTMLRLGAHVGRFRAIGLPVRARRRREAEAVVRVGNREAPPRGVVAVGLHGARRRAVALVARAITGGPEDAEASVEATAVEALELAA